MGIITPAVLPEKAEEEEDEESRKAKDKVRDQFAERQKKVQEEETIIITPAVLPEKAEEEEEEEDEESRKGRAKVRDEFAERQKKEQEEEKIIITPAVLPEKAEEEEEEEEEEARKGRAKVRDEFAEREKKVKEEEKIIITPAVLPERKEEEEEEEDLFKITPGRPLTRQQQQRGREDSSMIKLGMMLQDGGLTYDKYRKVKGHYRNARDGASKEREFMRDIDIVAGAEEKKSVLDTDVLVQKQVSIMIKRENITISAKQFRHHTEHVIMIRLGKLHQSGTLTFEKYTTMKTTHRLQMKSRVQFKEVEFYDSDNDVFAKLDAAVTNHPIIVKIMTAGAIPKREEHDKVIQIAITKLLEETRIPITTRDFKYHMEQIIMIRMGNLLKAGTLTFHKYNTMKQEHVQDIKDAIRNGEVESYDFSTDIFTKLDVVIGVNDTSADVEPMVVVGPEEKEEEESRKGRAKVR